MTILHDLKSKALIDPPKMLLDNTQYLVRMGSEAYGASLGGKVSDIDVHGFAIPRKEDVFPHTAGFITGFGKAPQPFQQWQQHHVKDGEKEYDLSIYSIVKFFSLAMDNNPNMLDLLFVPQRCVIQTTNVANLVRERRREFLHKGSMHKLRGYAFSQMAQIKGKQKSANEKRQSNIDEFGFDTKHAYHVVRLCLQAEQILAEHDLDLERNSKMLLAVRRGEWTLDQLTAWFEAKERSLETLYANSTLRHVPDEDNIKSLLLRCLEEHYGRLDAVVQKPNSQARMVREMQAVLDRYT